MAGSDINGAIEFSVQDGVRNGRGGSLLRTQENAAAVRAENGSGGAPKLLRKESSIVTDDKNGILCLRFHMAGNGRGGSPDSGEGEVFCNYSAPAGCAEMDDGLVGHGRLLYRGAEVAHTLQSHEGDSQE